MPSIRNRFHPVGYVYLNMVCLLNSVWLDGEARRFMLRQVIYHSLCEPPRVNRRLHFLRGSSDEQTDEIFPGVPETGDAAGIRAPGRIQLAVGCNELDCLKGGLYGEDAA